MPIPFLNFKPADYHKGKESYVATMDEMAFSNIW